jgi:hypothetical protein
MSSIVAQVSADDYLRDLLARERIDTAMQSPLRALGSEVSRLVKQFTGSRSFDLYPTGGFEKGTANGTGRSIDFLVSFSSSTPDTVAVLYQGIFATLEKLGYEPQRRDVSVAVNLKGVDVDIIPGKRESALTDVHELWLNRIRRPVKTNLTQHILETQGGGRREEIRVLKLWRDQQGLDFPSFYLELSVLAALKRRPPASLAENVWAVLAYYETLFPARSVLDPVNANNIVSDLLTPTEKDAVRKAAQYARGGRPWSEIVW